MRARSIRPVGPNGRRALPHAPAPRRPRDRVASTRDVRRGSPGAPRGGAIPPRPRIHSASNPHPWRHGPPPGPGVRRGPGTGPRAARTPRLPHPVHLRSAPRRVRSRVRRAVTFAPVPSHLEPRRAPGEPPPSRPVPRVTPRDARPLPTDRRGTLVGGEPPGDSGPELDRSDPPRVRTTTLNTRAWHRARPSLAELRARADGSHARGCARWAGGS